MAFPQLRRYRAFSGTSEKHRSISCGDILTCPAIYCFIFRVSDSVFDLVSDNVI